MPMAQKIRPIAEKLQSLKPESKTSNTLMKLSFSIDDWLLKHRTPWYGARKQHVNGRGRRAASVDPRAELLAKRPGARRRDRDRTGAFVASDPSAIEAMGAD